MKIGFYLYSGSDTEFTGVEKKIDNQIRAFSNKYQVTKVAIKKDRTNLIKSIIWRVPFGSWGAKYEEALEYIEDCSKGKNIAFIYIRTQFFDRKYLLFLKQLRQTYRDTKILLEIPTYPYDYELIRSVTMWPWYFKDKIYSRWLKNYVDRIVTFSDHNSIFGIPTIRTTNGMDVSSFSLARVENVDNDSINMIAVAMMQPYHGFERLIKGLASYYANGGKRTVRICFVGYGSELDMYQKLTEKYQLTEYISFKGKLQGEELDRAYDGCDLAVGSMGGYKIGIDMFSSIKLGEYLAKGLPVVTGGKTLVFNRYGDEYNLDFPNDDSEIDMTKVVEFYDSIYSGKDKNEVRNSIRNFAFRTIDINVVMKEIIDYLESA